MSTVKISTMVADMPAGLHRLEYYAIDRTGNRSVDAALSFTILKTFNVKNYGAKGDGNTDDTQAVRNTVTDAMQYSTNNNNALVAVYFPNGRYLTRQLVIYSNMYFIGESMQNTVLKRIVDADMFNFPDVPSTVSGGDTAYKKAFIKNYNFGSGNRRMGIVNMTIDGNGYAFLLDGNQNKTNPCVHFKRSTDIFLDRVKVVDSMNFHVWFRESSNITVKRLEINGRSNSPVNDRNNQDGLHFQGVNDVYVEYVKAMETGDDSLVIRSDDNRATWNTYVKYAELKNVGSGRGLLLDAEGNMDCYNVTIDKVIVHGYPRTGIGIQHSQEDPVDGSGTLYNIHIGEAIVYGYGLSNASDLRALYISSRPASLYSSSRGTQYIHDVTIDRFVFDASSTTASTRLQKIQRGILIEGAYAIRINNFQILGRSNQGEDIKIAECNANANNPIILDNGMIRRRTGGGWDLIYLNNSQYITLNSITIPKIDTNNDGIPDSNQGGAGLSIAGESKYITATNCVFATNTLYKLDTTAMAYAGTNNINIAGI